MKASVRKAAAMKLEAEYSQLRKQQAHGNANKSRRPINVAANPIASSQIGTLNLSPNIETPSQLKPSKPVTFAEKTALKYLFTISARSPNADALS
jgi:hypothetical protein